MYEYCYYISSWRRKNRSVVNKAKTILFKQAVQLKTCSPVRIMMPHTASGNTAKPASQVTLSCTHHPPLLPREKKNNPRRPHARPYTLPLPLLSPPLLLRISAMVTNGNSGVVPAHKSTLEQTTPKLRDLSVGSPSPKERKRKRRPEESDVEDSGAAITPGGGGGGEGAKEEGVSKKERKRNKKKRREREQDSDDDGGRKETDKRPKRKERREKRDRSERRSSSKHKDRTTTTTPDANASSSNGDTTPPLPPPVTTALQSPLDSVATLSPGGGAPSRSSLRREVNAGRRLLRKSVSFTADTKATDGDSIKTLYENHDPFAHYASYQQHINDYPTNELPEGFDDEPRPKKQESKGKHERFDSDETAPPPTLTLTPALSQKKQKKRERKEIQQKEKEAKEDADDEANGAEHGAKLSYLLTYHTSRDTWKFEKGKQNWILRHAFNPAKIPDEGYGAALKSYITGLLSPAARDRLLAEANEIVKRGKDTISKDGERLNPEDQKTNVTRAKLVLSALGHEDDEDDDDDEEEEDSSDEEE